MCFIKEYLFVKAQNFCHLIAEGGFTNKKPVSKNTIGFLQLLMMN